MGEFHSKEGWFFQRESGGEVRVRHDPSVSGLTASDRRDVVMLDADVWASVVASVSASGETAETWQAVRRFHAGGGMTLCGGVIARTSSGATAAACERPENHDGPCSGHAGRDIIVERIEEGVLIVKEPPTPAPREET